MKTRLAALTPALAILAFAAPAGAATSGVSSEAVSENWAGYEASTSNADGFEAVSGSWVQPKVSTAAGQSYSAYWVGLGGGSQNSDALEQDGTQADVSADGKVSYYAWYELVPSAPVKIPVTVHAGDKIYARTYVNGDNVTFTLDNKTTGQNWTKTVKMTAATPDTSTAEWVAEAPSECSGGAEDSSSCSVLNLADFGSVKFTDANARSDGQVKSVSGWNSEAIAMSPTSGSSDNSYGGYGGGYGGGFGAGFGGGSAAGLGGATGASTATGSSEGAAPGSLSSDGSAFTVTYGSDQAVAGTTGTTGSSGTTGTTGSGYGDSSYGDSGYGDSGYGYGYGDSGYGDSGYGYGYGDATSGYLSAYEQAVLNALSGYGESYYGGGNSAGQGYGY